jgi:hypothetical protein
MPASFGTAACGGVCGSTSRASRPQGQAQDADAIDVRRAGSNLSVDQITMASHAHKKIVEALPGGVCGSSSGAWRPALTVQQITSAVSVAQGTVETLLEPAGTRPELSARPHVGLVAATRAISGLLAITVPASLGTAACGRVCGSPLGASRPRGERTSCRSLHLADVPVYAAQGAGRGGRPSGRPLGRGAGRGGGAARRDIDALYILAAFEGRLARF